MEPRCCRAREIERGETGFQRLANSINLKKHFTPIPPYAWVFTIKLREIKFGQGTRSRHRALGSRYELMMNRGMRKRRFRPNGGKVVQGHTRDRVWRMGSENPTANIPVVVVDVVPAGPLRRRCRWAHVLGWSQIEVERVDPTGGRRPRLLRWRRWRGWRLESKKPRRGGVHAFVFVFHASKKVTLCKVSCIMSSNPSNRFESSSMEVDVWVSNLVGFRRAIARSGTRI